MPRYSNFSAAIPKKTSKLINENAHVHIFPESSLKITVEPYNFSPTNAPIKNNQYFCFENFSQSEKYHFLIG
jgi:hypothetical protein